MPLAFFLSAGWRLANPRLASLLDKLVGGVVIALAIGATVLAIRHGGERAGAAKVEIDVERAHIAAAADARADERAAAQASTAVATNTARATGAAADTTRSTIEDLHHAIADVPPPAPGDALPSAPVDRLRDQLNAGIADANRAADAADALP